MWIKPCHRSAKPGPGGKFSVAVGVEWCVNVDTLLGSCLSRANIVSRLSAGGAKNVEGLLISKHLL
jgi:hypothetical protein